MHDYSDAFNHIEQQRCQRRKPHLLRACAASFLLFFAGYLLMSLAPNIWALVPATIVRSMGSSVVWVYSTLLIQLRVPNQLQGRMMALEMAAYVVRTASKLPRRMLGFKKLQGVCQPLVEAPLGHIDSAFRP